VHSFEVKKKTLILFHLLSEHKLCFANLKVKLKRMSFCHNIYNDQIILLNIGAK